MSVDNETPFPALAFRQYNLAGDLLGVVVARGTFKLSQGGQLKLAEEQYPLVMSDTYDGDPHQTPQMACTDLAPFKPATDVTLVGFAHAPDARPQANWTCRLSVGPVEKRLRVFGPRLWRAKTRRTWQGLLDRTKEDVFDGWELTDPQPVETVPLDWRFAYGGPPSQSAEADALCERNPVGCGRADRSRFRGQAEWPAAQIEADDAPVTDPEAEQSPQGFGPLSPWWSERYRFAGTYDEAWLAERHPLLPRDFDFRFWQCAPPGLIADPWLRGDEAFALEHLLPGLAFLSGRLPGIGLEIEIDQGSGPVRTSMVLDGVHFDLRPGVGRVFLTWRTGFPWPERRGVPRLYQATDGGSAV